MTPGPTSAPPPVMIGLIGLDGGAVVVLSLPGLETCRGATQNGESSTQGPASARASVFDTNA